MSWLTRLGAVSLVYAALTGCATTGGGTRGSGDLDRWVDRELVPQVTKELSEHPRLKDQPFVIVAMHNDDTQPEIDALSGHIRQRLQDGLRNAPGAQLMWQPGRVRGQHHRSLEQVDCSGTLQQPALQVGIDSQISPLTGKLHVAVKAVDLRQGNWIAGFAHQWEGEATEPEAKALKIKATDEYLRGLRELPFEGNDADLLASYLAHNLSCVLRDVKDTKIAIYVPIPADAPAFFVTAIHLLDNYLGRFNEVKIVETPENASFTLRSEAHNLSNGLYQVWASAVRVADQTVVGGAATSTYVRLDGKAPVTGMVAAPAPVGLPDAPLVMGGPALVVNSVSSGRSTQRESPVELQIVTPVDAALCTTHDPWRGGARTVNAKDELPANGCFAVEVTPNTGGKLTVLLHSAEGQVQKLAPNHCNAAGVNVLDFSLGTASRIPALAGSESVFDVGGGAGKEWVYALIAQEGADTRAYDELIASVPDLCETQASYRSDVATFQSQLKKLAESGNVNWAAAVVHHR